MDSLRGVLGNCVSLSLRMGQAFFSVASMVFMCYGIQFDSYTPYWLLVTVTGLVITWSLTISVLDLFSIALKRPIHPPFVLQIIIIGDWLFAHLCLASSCVSFTLTSLLISYGNSFCTGYLCRRYQMAAAMAFFDWFLLFVSALLNLWIIPSV